MHAFLFYVVFLRGDGRFHLLGKVGTIGKRLPSLRSIRRDYESDIRSILFFKFVRPPTLKNHCVMFVLGRFFFPPAMCVIYVLCFCRIVGLKSIPTNCLSFLFACLFENGTFSFMPAGDNTNVWTVNCTNLGTLWLKYHLRCPSLQTCMSFGMRMIT